MLVVDGAITERRVKKLLREHNPRTTIFLGSAAPLARIVLPAVDEFTIIENRVRPRASADEPLHAATTPSFRRLHLACGPETLAEWVNIDNQPYPGVDRLLDLRDGLPFPGADFIFAEHFIEHIEYGDALALFTECKRVLGPTGVLRVSTPNLDWVWFVSYHPGQWATDRDAIRDCLVLNRAFRGWGHRFLYNWNTLRESLLQAGFSTVTRCSYGESSYPELRGIERHDQYLDSPELPHILIVEATGRGTHVPEEAVAQDIGEYLHDMRLS